jgi:2-polyprenyl-3-methyl-5-hydroxy-6-metoxy-1,4-benzoquinol methylase
LRPSTSASRRSTIRDDELIGWADVSVDEEPLSVRSLSAGDFADDGRQRRVGVRFTLLETSFKTEFRVRATRVAPLAARLAVDVRDDRDDAMNTTDTGSNADPSPLTLPPDSRGFVRRVGRIVLWPLRRFFDPRFAGITAAQTATVEQVAAGRAEAAERQDEARGLLADLRRLAEADMDAATEAAAVIGSSLADLADRVDRVGEDVDRVGEETELLSRRYLLRAQEGAVDELDERAAAFLNYASSRRGFAGQAGLWLNPSVIVEYGPGYVRVAGTNERIVELPYALKALSGVPAGARVLDVGAAESTLAFSLACLGYEVTAVDPRGYPFEHPRLRVVEGAVEDVDIADGFDAVVCLSTIEHIGLAAYGQGSAERADLAAMTRLRELTKPGSVLILTTPFGRAETSESERRYDREGIDALLEGWDVRDLAFARRLGDSGQWTVEAEPADDGEPRVALVTAQRAA